MVEFFLLTFSLRGEIKQNSKKTSSKNIFATFLFVQHFRSKSFYFYFIFANDTDSHKASLKVVKNDGPGVQKHTICQKMPKNI